MPRSRRSRKKSGPNPFVQAFYRSVADYHERTIARLVEDERDTEPRVRLTVTALVLKACFVRLAHERHFLNADSLPLFADLVKLRRHKKRDHGQVAMWEADLLHVAVDNLLENLEVNSSLVARAHLGELFTLLSGYRLDRLDRDILGGVYQAVSQRDARKASGQYYTPPAVVESILDDLSLDPLARPELSVCDPACGSGQFLLGAYDRLKAHYLDAGQTAFEAHRRIVEEHLFGFDIDPFAIVLTRMNLFLKERGDEPLRFNIHRVNPLDRGEHKLFCCVAGTDDMIGRFDCIIGNPPWGSKLDAREKAVLRSEFVSAQSGVNSFTLFIERGLELLNDGGRLGFLIPDAYLNIRAHRASRKLLLETAHLRRIATCGELFERVFAPSMILVAEKIADRHAATERAVQIVTDLGAPGESRRTISQAAFLSTPEQIFNIHMDDGTRRLLSQIDRGGARFKGHATWGLGIVTGDNGRLISRFKQSPRHEALIVGRDLLPYRIRESRHFIIYDRSELQQACPREIFDAPQKLVYRFIGKRLVFALDDQGRFTLNNANVLIPKLPGFRPAYLLALLNSSVLQYYYTFSFFTLKVLRGNLERLPLKWAPEERQQAIEAAVAELAGLEGDAFDAQVLAIDRAVAGIYGISNPDYASLCRRLAEELGDLPQAGPPRSADAA